MNSSLKKIAHIPKRDLVWGTALFLTFAAYYSFILISRIPTDLQPHAKMAYSYSQGEVKLLPNFLYFFLLSLFTGFSKQYALYYIPAVILMSAAITAKFFITKFYAVKFCSICKENQTYPYLIAIVMLFVFPLPGVNYFTADQFYMGQLAPNVWHSSTTIFLMPFAEILFFESYSLLFLNDKNTKNKIVQVLVLLTLNALIKPSFLFTLLPTVGIFFFVQYLFLKKETNYLVKILPYVIGCIFIAVEYYFIYKLNYSGVDYSDKTNSGIAFEPFAIWKSYSPNLVIAFITSFFFPLVYILVSKGAVLKNTIVRFSLCNYLIGLSLWILLAEQGFRRSDGNFIWQMVVAGYLVFFTMLIEFLNAAKNNTLTKMKQWIAGGSFFLHFAWGVFYWVKIIIFSNYA
jgi:hypothetical protein